MHSYNEGSRALFALVVAIALSAAIIGIGMLADFAASHAASYISNATAMLMP